MSKTFTQLASELSLKELKATKEYYSDMPLALLRILDKEIRKRETRKQINKNKKRIKILNGAKLSSKTAKKHFKHLN